MANYLDLLKLIEQGMSLSAIVSELKLPPSRVKRILARKRLQQHLELERMLSEVAVGHALAAGALEMQQRCAEIARNSDGETARKAAQGLLDDARAQSEAAMADEAQDMEEDTPRVFS